MYWVGRCKEDIYKSLYSPMSNISNGISNDTLTLNKRKGKQDKLIGLVSARRIYKSLYSPMSNINSGIFNDSLTLNKRKGKQDKLIYTYRHLIYT